MSQVTIKASGGGSGGTTSFVTDSGTATPSSGVITIVGSQGILTSGAGSTVTVTLTSPVSIAHGGTALSTVPTNGQLLIGNGTGYSLAVITGSGGITVTNGAGTINISGSGATGFNWVIESTTTRALLINQGVFANPVTLCTLTLPATSAVGDTIQISATGIGLCTIAQNAGQQMFTLSGDTTIGVTGRLTALIRYSCVTLICTVANTNWLVTQQSGAWTIV